MQLARVSSGNVALAACCDLVLPTPFIAGPCYDLSPGACAFAGAPVKQPGHRLSGSRTMTFFVGGRAPTLYLPQRFASSKLSLRPLTHHPPLEVYTTYVEYEAVKQNKRTIKGTQANRRFLGKNEKRRRSVTTQKTDRRLMPKTDGQGCAPRLVLGEVVSLTLPPYPRPQLM